MSSRRPPLRKTHGPWDLKVKVWQRMAHGDPDSVIETWLETSGSEYFRDRSTRGKLRDELIALPDRLARDLPEGVQAYRKELREPRPGVGPPPQHDLISNSEPADILSEDRPFFSQRLLKGATGIPNHEHGERSLALKLSFDGDELSIALACKPFPAAEVAYIEDVDVLEGGDSKARLDKVAELVAAEEVTRVVTVEEAPMFFLLELRKRGVRCNTLRWTGETSFGNIRDNYFGHFKEWLGQRRLRLPCDAMLRAELGRITVTPCGDRPSYVLANYEAAGRAEVAVIASAVAVLRPPLFGGIG